MTRATGVMAVETQSLGKRYGSLWALKECNIQIPTGRISALLGPNGAGKTTLLRLLVGLSQPSTGQAQVLGKPPGQTTEFLESIGYLAQEAPLYKRLTVEDHLAIGARLNPRWDDSSARDRLARLKIPLGRRVNTLSGGQRSQVALGIALSKRPSLLLLDEPVAALDPLARKQFLGSLTEAVATGDLSVILSSHLVRDLENVCDHVVLLNAASTQLCDDIETVLATHELLVGPRQNTATVDRTFTVVSATHTSRQSKVLVRAKEGRQSLDGPADLERSFDRREVSLEEVILAYMGQGEDSEGTGPLSALKGAS